MSTSENRQKSFPLYGTLNYIIPPLLVILNLGKFLSAKVSRYTGLLVIVCIGIAATLNLQSECDLLLYFLIDHCSVGCLWREHFT